MQVRRGTGRVRLRAVAVRDQQASAGHRAALPEAGRDMLVMYPADAQKRNLIRSAALLAFQGTEWLQLGLRTDHSFVRARNTYHKLCDDVGGKGSAPNRVTFENERFVTLLSGC